MLKFTYISKELFQIIQSSLIDFKEVQNQLTGGDNDFVLLDEVNKEYSWFEFGTISVSDLIFNDEQIFENSEIKNLLDLIQKILEDVSMFSYEEL